MIKVDIRPKAVGIPVGSAMLMGDLQIPDKAGCVVLFVHGSSSSRFSPRNRYVARVLAEAGLATLLMDLLTEEEEAVDEETSELRFDIPFLTQRVIAVTDWIKRDLRTQGLAVGYLGASTGAAAALTAAAEKPRDVYAIVSRGGRPDLAREALPRVKAPTLFIVGGKDTVSTLNHDAARLMRAEHEVVIVPGATHLFEEPGTLETVAQLATEWFVGEAKSA